MAHSEKKKEWEMVKGEQSLSRRMIGLSFTVYCLPHALRYALSALRQGEVQSRVHLGRDSLFLYFLLD